MSRAVGLLAALAFAAVAHADPLLELEQRQQELFTQVAPSVVFIAAQDGFGSGFFVAPEGLILTNAHVVKKAQRVDVVTHDGAKYVGEVIERASDDVDLALVKVALRAPAPVLPMVGLREARVGSWVAAVGHGHGAVWTFNTGMVSNIYPDKTDHPVFQTQIPLNPGNSGGPIVDREGRVVGVVTAGIFENASSINFGIALEVAWRSLSALTPKCDCLVVHAPKGIPVFVDGAMAGMGPRVVVPATRKSYEVFGIIGGRRRLVTARYPDQREVELQ